MSDAEFDRRIAAEGRRIARRALRALRDTVEAFPVPGVRS